MSGVKLSHYNMQQCHQLDPIQRYTYLNCYLQRAYYPYLLRKQQNIISKLYQNIRIKQQKYKINTQIYTIKMQKITKQTQQKIKQQYKTIVQQFTKIHKQRKELNNQKSNIQTNLNFVQRTKQSLDSKLKTKRQQLKWLKSIRERHLSDMRYKIQQEGANNRRVQQLKKQSQYARQISRKNIIQALQNKKQQKLKTTSQIKNQLSQIKRIKQLQQSEMNSYYTLRSKQLQEEKQQGRKKINKFYHRKNKLLLNSYREMIKNQQLISQQSQSQISYIQNRSDKLDKQINKKRNKLKSIQDQIIKLRIEANDTRSVNGFSFDSRLTIKSSKPNNMILKQTLTEFLKDKN